MWFHFGCSTDKVSRNSTESYSITGIPKNLSTSGRQHRWTKCITAQGSTVNGPLPVSCKYTGMLTIKSVRQHYSHISKCYGWRFERLPNFFSATFWDMLE
jgi:hypothetical protein